MYILKNVNLFAIFFGLLLIGAESCKNHDKKNADKLEKDLIDYHLKFDSEKITLISYISQVNTDTLKLILKDYLTKVNSVNLVLDSTEKLSEIEIESISKKYKIPTRKVSSLIFMYKYDVIPVENLDDGYRYEMDDVSDRY